MSETSFPRQQARTRRFSLGVPRNFAIAPDGGRVLFLRTRSGTDPLTCLWQFDVGSGAEQLLGAASVRASPRGGSSAFRTTTK